MKNSIIVQTTSTHSYGMSIQDYDCCQGLGDSVMNNKNTDYKAYIWTCIISFDKIDQFFLPPENLKDYLFIIGDIFNFELKLLSDISEFSDKIREEYPIDKHYYIECQSQTRRSNKEVVALHNVLRYTWYLHYSNIAIACVNLFRLKVLPDALNILAIASSYQTEAGRALLPSKLTEIDAFIYFPDKNYLLSELAKNIAFNTAFMATPIYYSPQIRIQGNFFDDSKETVLSAKNLLNSLGSVDSIDDIPPVIIKGIKQSLGDYVSIRDLYNRIVNYAKENKATGYIPIIITSENIAKHEVSVELITSMGHKKITKINF